MLGASGAEPRRGIRSQAKLRFRGGGEGAELRGIVVVVVTGLISAGECQRWRDLSGAFEQATVTQKHCIAGCCTARTRSKTSLFQNGDQGGGYQ